MVLASGLARAPAPMPAALSHRRLLIPATGAAAAAGALRNGLTACRSRAPRLPWPSTGGAGAGPVRKNLRNITVRAQAAAAADNGDSGSGGGSTGKPLPAPLAKLAALFRPLSDERCNSKLLALAVGEHWVRGVCGRGRREGREGMGVQLLKVGGCQDSKRMSRVCLLAWKQIDTPTRSHALAHTRPPAPPQARCCAPLPP